MESIHVCPDETFHMGRINLSIITLVLLNQVCRVFANSVYPDQDQLASEEANWSGSALFAH